jgi:hypothetical protein
LSELFAARTDSQRDLASFSLWQPSYPHAMHMFWQLDFECLTWMLLQLLHSFINEV